MMMPLQPWLVETDKALPHSLGDGICRLEQELKLWLALG